jgi:hypothetical protein
MAEPGRPLGVAILAVLIGIFAALTLLDGLFLLFGVTVGSAFGIPGFLGVAGLLLAGIVLLLGIVLLAVAYGLWDLRMWALVLAVLVLLIEVGLNALAGAFLSLGFLVSLVLLIYLVAVRRHFS